MSCHRATQTQTIEHPSLVRCVLVLLSLTMTTQVGCSSSNGIVYDDQLLIGIDMHLHTGEWEKIPPSTQNYLAEKFPFPLNLNPEPLAEDTLSAQGIIDQLDNAGLDQGVVFAVYAPHSVGIATNAEVIDLLDAKPQRLWGLASLRVDQWDTERDQQLANLREVLSHPRMIGIKLAHAHMHIRFDDPQYDPIYALAGELNKPVYLHTGPSPFNGTLADPPYTNPIYLEESIKRFPQTQFILGHMGFDFLNKAEGNLEECLALGKQYNNVFFEPSALGSGASDPEGTLYKRVLRRTKEEGLVDRMIYGSDGPQYPGFLADYATRTRDAMKAAGYTAEEAQAVFKTNFERLFGLSP